MYGLLQEKVNKQGMRHEGGRERGKEVSDDEEWTQSDELAHEDCRFGIIDRIAVIYDTN